MKLFIRLLVNAFALYCAAYFIDGIRYSGSMPGLIALALVFTGDKCKSFQEIAWLISYMGFPLGPCRLIRR